MGINTSILGALEDRVAFAQTSNSSIPSYEQQENTRTRQGIGQNKLRTTILPAKTEISTIGPGGVSKSQGLFQIDVFTPKSEGYNSGREISDLIVDYFKVGDVLTKDGIDVIVINTWIATTYFMENVYVTPIKIEWNSWNYRG